MEKLEYGEWKILQRGVPQALLGQWESMFCQGNGYMGVRAAPEEQMPERLRGSFVAGSYNSFAGEVTELPNAPDIFYTRLVANGQLVVPTPERCDEYTTELNLENGLLQRRYTYTAPGGEKLRVEAKRFLSQASIHLAVQQITVTALDECEIVLTAGIDGQLSNSGAQHFAEGGHRYFGAGLVQADFTTTQSEINFFYAAASSLGGAGAVEEVSVERRKIGVAYRFHLRGGQSAVLLKCGALYTSRDAEYISGPCSGAQDALRLCKQAQMEGFEKLLRENEEKWAEYWLRHDVTIEGETALPQTALRFALYHIKCMTPLHDSRMNIGAKGLSGETYKGHVFWDTEMFLLAPWLYTEPEVAGRLLQYRGLCLPKAREKARQYGCEGALFPWESGWITDGEVTPLAGVPDIVTGRPIPIRTGVQEIHVNADIPYMVCQYYLATGDTGFMRRYGCRLLAQTALYWASRAVFNPRARRYEIHEVIGPDEYSEGVNNNAYTNTLAAWNLKAALAMAKELQTSHPEFWRQLAEETGLQGALPHIRRVAEELYVPKPGKNGLIPQDDTFLKLPRINIAPYKGKPGAILKKYNVDQLCGYQVSKQADLVMLLSLLGETLTPDIVEKNYRYYEECCLHDSSLSYGAHCIVAARLGLPEAYSLFEKAATVDFGSHGLSTAGIHAAAMGGLWQAAVQGFGGVQIKEGALWLAPRLPKQWRRLEFALCWRGTLLRVQVGRKQTAIAVTGGEPRAEVVFFGKVQQIEGEVLLHHPAG